MQTIWAVVHAPLWMLTVLEPQPLYSKESKTQEKIQKAKCSKYAVRGHGYNREHLWIQMFKKKLENKMGLKV